MLLEGKNAVIYGAGGSIGGAVAKAFAREGARVFLAGRTQATLDAVADDIRAAGGTAETAEVDALDEASVDAHADAIEGGIDISFNVIGLNDVQGTPLADMAVADFMAPVETALRSYFLTSRAAARHMIPRGGGVILTFGGEGDPIRDYSIGGLQIAFHAVEAMRRQLATELGRHGIRTVTLRTGGVPETIPEDFEERGRIAEMLEGATLLGRTATLEDVGNVAAFVASDQGRTMTAATVNVSCGALLD
jgi:NAD(P)-dependent dehydrogenase (short-subunit alcohol dehydrogenase family)